MEILYLHDLPLEILLIIVENLSISDFFTIRKISLFDKLCDKYKVSILKKMLNKIYTENCIDLQDKSKFNIYVPECNIKKFISLKDQTILINNKKFTIKKMDIITYNNSILTFEKSGEQLDFTINDDGVYLEKILKMENYELSQLAIKIIVKRLRYENDCNIQYFFFKNLDPIYEIISLDNRIIDTVLSNFKNYTRYYEYRYQNMSDLCSFIKIIESGRLVEKNGEYTIICKFLLNTIMDENIYKYLICNGIKQYFNKYIFNILN